MTFFFGDRSFAQRSGDLQIQNFMRPSVQLLIYAMWPPEAHEFDTPGLSNFLLLKLALLDRFDLRSCHNQLEPSYTYGLCSQILMT